MTQLFDTHTYEDLETADRSARSSRHLRSMPTGDDAAEQLAERTTQWRLDNDTIEIGRKGIKAARAALQDAAKEAKDAKPARKAA